MCSVKELMRIQPMRRYYYETRRDSEYHLISQSSLLEDRGILYDDAINGDNDYKSLPTTLEKLDNSSLLIRALDLWERYGSDFGTNKTAYDAFRGEVINLHKEYGFGFRCGSVIDFVFELDALYDVYLLWVRKYFGDDLVYYRFRNDMEAVSIDESLSSLLKDVTIEKRLEIVQGNPIVFEICDGIFCVLVAQMLDIILQGEKGLDGRSVGYCKECGAVFIREHGRASLCKYCRTNAVKLRNYRARQKAKMKEAEGNGRQEK